MVWPTGPNTGNTPPNFQTINQMNKFIFFKDIFHNLQHIKHIWVEADGINIQCIDGTSFRYNSSQYDEAEKRQLLEDLESFM